MQLKDRKIKMKNPSNIYFVGPLGAGKSTIGREVARLLDKDFYDTDRVIEERTGVNISWIFDIEGEDSFREREKNVVEELSQLSNVVISTGGGTILVPESRQYLSDSGIVILLKTDIDQQIERTRRNQYNRPLLRGDDMEDKIQTFNVERMPLYESIADASFTTDIRRTKVVTDEILQFLNDTYPEHY